MDFLVDFFSELAHAICVDFFISLAKGSPLVCAHDKLARVKRLKLKAFVYKVILCYLVQLSEVDILLKLLQHYLLLSELFL